MKHSKGNMLLVLTLAAVLLAASGLLLIRFQQLMTGTGIQDTESSSYYDWHFAMVVGDTDDQFWSSAYEAAAQAARESGAVLELTGGDQSGAYDVQDQMRMAIAQQVDGILLYPDGTEEMTTLIDSATSQGIPVITLMEDDTDSTRQAHVGGNSYDQGLEYGQLITQLCQEAEEVERVTVLLDANRSTSQEILYAAILETCDGLALEIQAVTVESGDTFSAEETVRDLIVEEERPDLLVCLSDMDTTSAYRAVVDYNRVGVVRLIGNYDAAQTLTAIQKGIIYATVTVDPQQLGVQAVESLTEYLTGGRTSGYTTVDQVVITQETVEAYLAEKEAES